MRDINETIRSDPESRRAGAWAHWLSRRGIDPSRLVEENGAGAETDGFYRRTVADIQAGYDLIQKSPMMYTEAGKFFGQYQAWAVNQTRNVLREIVLPLWRASTGQGKQIEVRVGDRTYRVNDSALTAAKRGLSLVIGSALAGSGTDAFRRYVLGKPNPSQDWERIAADIASDSHKMRGFAYAANALFNETLSGQMLGLFSQAAQIAQDPADRQRYKDWLRPTTSAKLYALTNLFLHTLQQKQFNSHDLDGLLRSNFAFYREGKAALGRLLNNAPDEPDWAKEEITLPRR